MALSIIDSRTNLKVTPNITVRYMAAPGESWVLLSALEEDDKKHVIVQYQRLRDNKLFEERLPIHGFWIFRAAYLDVDQDTV